MVALYIKTQKNVNFVKKGYLSEPDQDHGQLYLNLECEGVFFQGPGVQQAEIPILLTRYNQDSCNLWTRFMSSSGISKTGYWPRVQTLLRAYS